MDQPPRPARNERQRGRHNRVRRAFQHEELGERDTFPFEERTFPGPAALIWNNSSSDPGALWNPNGSLISYWPD